MNRIYLVDWSNNYGLDCVVIVGDITSEQAKHIAIAKAGAWKDSISVKEINVNTKGKPVIIHTENKSQC